MTPTVPSPAELLARAGWFGVSEAILAGLCHDLNNRAASLTGLIQLIEEGGDDMLTHVGTEVDRLASSVNRIRALNGRRDDEMEPLAPSDVVAVVLDLHRRRRGLEAVTTASRISEGLPPVLASPTRLERMLLILLDQVVSGVLAEGGKDAELVVTGSASEVCFELSAIGEATAALDETVRDALADLAGRTGWTLDQASGPVRLTLPSLTRARAAEG